MNHKEVKELVVRHYAKKEPLLILGTTGIGKSQLVRQAAIEIAQKEGLKYSEGWSDINNPNCFCLIDLRVSDMDRTDLSGYPVPDMENKTMQYFGFEGFPKNGKGIIFADELNLAPTSVQKAMYALILDRKLHGYYLPEGYVIVAAGNTFEDRADIMALPGPLEQRFSIITLDPPETEEWLEWAGEHKIDPRIMTFIKRLPDRLFKYSADLMMTTQPIPRQWEHLSHLIEDEESIDFIKNLAIARVGMGAGIEFYNFLKLSQNIDIEAIFDGKANIPRDIDLAYSVMGALANIFKKDPEGNWEKAIDVAEKYEKISPEFAVLWIRLVKEYTPEAKLYSLFMKNKKSGDFLSRYAKYYKAEGK